MAKKKNEITLTLKFDMDHPEVFGRFCKAMAKGGFPEALQEMLSRLKTEAVKRGIEVSNGKK